MGKNLFIAEKPSVAREFARVLQLNTSNRDGYMESDQAIVTWCVGHLVTMSYPEVYDMMKNIKGGLLIRFLLSRISLNMRS